MMEETDTSHISGGTDRKIKVTVVGDSGVGKTCLLMAFANNKFPDEDICCQSLFENSKGTVRVGSEGSFEVPVTMETEDGQIELGLTDTIGTENYRSLREVFAANSDIFLVCFSVTDPQTLANVKDNWLNEICELTPGAPFILVGTKTDLRENEEITGALKVQGIEPTSLLQGIKFAKRLGAKEYVECSALNMIGIKSVFQSVVVTTDPDQSKQKAQAKRKSGNYSCIVS
ncbi:cdc42 homolog [Mercenaria mercenaria]|uniref:cdc42 homolog n=1 Tax=Mercenaria mercenaria TaxID=6596 RepID=UPI001E1E1F11|nr:cdc42 homolog [Mercenaria mercenaria]